MKILMVTPELTPFVKVGGLGDVAGALPKALESQGHKVRIVCPLHPEVKIDTSFKEHTSPLFVKLNEVHYAKVWETTLQKSKVIVYFIEYQKYFDRDNLYSDLNGDSYSDNGFRFAFFSRAALDLLPFLNWFPDVIHCNDWTTGFVPLYLNTTEANTRLHKIATVFTIHNIQHQGYCDRSVIEYANLPAETFRDDCCEAMGAVNMLKAGLYGATKISTVSPQYAKEVQTDSYGYGLDGLLRFRAADLVGILNGIDTNLWNPKVDPFIAAPYSPNNLEPKATCKDFLQKRFGLKRLPNVPIFGVVSRLYEQKGLDFLADIASAILQDMEIQLVILGSGDPYLESRFKEISERYPSQVGVYIGRNIELSHQIEAGSDFFIMPSRFEPCGLNQMYSMRYGTPPIVRSTGGLMDSVKQYQEDSGEGTGFMFEEASAHALYYTIGWACSTYYDRRGDYLKIQYQGMKSDFSWKKSAEKYVKLYQWAIQTRQG